MSEFAISDDNVNEIAIIGMACRFPGASRVDKFWQNLCDGVNSISFFSDEELETSGIDSAIFNDPNYVRAGGYFEGIELFDAAFFGFNPKEAQMMDPQHRLFLECAWEVLESAGYDTDRYEGAVGVYAGVGHNSYLLQNLLSNPHLIEAVGAFQTSFGNDKDFVPTRVSYKLNLQGPSVNVQTACSTSLVAIHLACQSLLNGECDMALAGGVSITSLKKEGYFYQEDGIYSPDGYCRAFDADAKGMVGGNGVGVVVLKRLADALDDRDNIYAVIKGSAINNDGTRKVGYTAPSIDGQIEVITEAQAIANVEPETVTYIETHGTATALGDPIEIAALTQAFRLSVDDKGFCAIGSVKTNIGHLDTVAGTASIIKTAMALKHKLLPPSLHFKQPNPDIDFANSPFYVNAELSEWQTNGSLRRAGVSAFGLGGTNAHVVLEEAPPRKPSGPSRSKQLLALSAKTNTALEQATANLAKHLKQHPEASLADVAYTLHVGRKACNQRRMVVVEGIEDAIKTLVSLDAKRVFSTNQQTAERPVAFMFPGGGAHYINMGLELYQTEPIFREQIDNCAEYLRPLLGFDLRDTLYPTDERAEEATQKLRQTSVGLPAIFAVSYALARLWMSWGITPQAMIGHSLGEYVAACLAGVFSLKDALYIVYLRGQLFEQLPRGAMLSVLLPEEQVRNLLSDELSLATVNSPSQCVVSGPTEAVDKFAVQLDEQDLPYRRLQIDVAAHSAMLTPILEPFTEAMQKIDLQPPQLPYISNVTGTWVTIEDATDPTYWAKHLRQTVRFSEGIQLLLQEPSRILLEVGPGRALSMSAKQQPDMRERVVLTSLRHPKEAVSDVTFLLNSLGQLWLAGLPVDWDKFYTNEQRNRLPLPTYPFERQRYWVEPQQGVLGNAASRKHALRKKPDVADWFYTPSWKRSMLPPSVESLSDKKLCWLLFADTHGLGKQLEQRLQQTGQETVTVTPGKQFAQIDNHTYIVNPQDAASYETLMSSLQNLQKIPDKIVHLWGVSQNDKTALSLDDLENAQMLGFYSLLFLAQALGNQGTTEPLDLTVVTSSMQEVNGEEMVCPEKATIIGPVKVIPHEYKNVTSRSVDVMLPESGPVGRKLVDQLLTELVAASRDDVVAYRGKHRWTQTFEPIRLSSSETPRHLREHGVYLITGGLGGVGLTLAEYLAETVRAKLILVGRSGLPARSEWELWLATHDVEDGMSWKIEKVRAIEAMGAEVVVASADVANLSQMEMVVNQARQRFGPIHGVIHAAGIAPGGVIQLKSQANAANVLAPKVQGTVILDMLFKNDDLDFLALCSSLGSIVGGPGQVDYCAANAFQDAFAHRDNDPFTVAINWDTWQEVGLAANTEVPLELRAAREDHLKNGILPKEGADAFSRILNVTMPQSLVSTRDIQPQLEEQLLDSQETLDNQEAAMETPIAAPTYARPGLANDYVAPETEVEQIIADIWQDLLGIDKIGIHDNFFDLGGHSLLAIQVISRLHAALQVKLPMRSLFEAATVAKLAEVTEDILIEEIETMSEDEAQYLIEHSEI